MPPARTKTIAIVLIWASLVLGVTSALNWLLEGTAELAAQSKTRQAHQDWPTGPYQVMANWPQPLPDTRHSHDGWTWGSFGGVYAETPDRIWIRDARRIPLRPERNPGRPTRRLTLRAATRSPTPTG